MARIAFVIPDFVVAEQGGCIDEGWRPGSKNEAFAVAAAYKIDDSYVSLSDAGPCPSESRCATVGMALVIADSEVACACAVPAVTAQGQIGMLAPGRVRRSDFRSGRRISHRARLALSYARLGMRRCSRGRRLAIANVEGVALGPGRGPRGGMRLPARPRVCVIRG
jgi:hypothetical protein